jgi:Domain of unknown function (DUF6894)
MLLDARRFPPEHSTARERKPVAHVFPFVAAQSKSAMSRYYFHLTDGKETLKLPEGLDLPGNAAAREEAVVLARDLKRGKVMPGRDWKGWLVTVVDQHGHRVEAVPIADLPDQSA